LTNHNIYRNLADYFISAPLSALLTVLLGLSMAIVFDETGKAVFKRNELWIRASYFFSGLLITSWTIWLLALSGFISQPLLIAIAIAFITAALPIVIKKKGMLFITNAIQQLKTSGTESPAQKWLQYAGLTVLFIFFIISLTAPTDADSLDYHLGIPVEILRTESLWFDINNIHFRMAGFGEMLNLLGVANGCAQLGAFIQMLALLWLLMVYTEAIPRTSKSYLFSTMLGIPILLFLVPGQKHQLTGIAATSLCFYILCFQKGHFSKQVLLLWISTLLLAVGIKYSFIISAAALLLYALLQAKNSKRLWLYGILLGLLFTGPLFLYRYIHFGDPLSPLVEGLKPNPDPFIIQLGRFFHSFQDPGFGFPLGVFLPASLGSVSVTMGWCAVLLLLAFTLYKQDGRECLVALLFIILTVSVGQKTARFFIEPYLWLLLPVLLHLSQKKWGKYALRMANVQLLLLLPVVLFSFYSLAPAILSNKLREKVLIRSSFGYAESKWLDEVLPAEARIATGLRSRAYLPTPFFPREYLYLGTKRTELALQTKQMIQTYGINYLVLEKNEATEKLLTDYNAILYAGPKKFNIATRNPFNSAQYELAIYKLK